MSPTTPVICDTVAAATYVKVTPATVRQWIRRGHIQRTGYDTAGRALVDLRDVRAYLTQRSTTAA
ncbi:helix-turn-helix domain-containing protein [Streptomyces sp. NPDC020379]|uniref:Helix-turn-helix domain-containing protein n=1 Tax=Streptomyces hesseae TaxID=3075519 RepID=A0ABU2SS92_9ACTN|nr:helix-turn-helix domain-containing protein [Streptomyces sp. DSM 40473]MDT0451857.1 helix-turn-helix domain-containing protein [Streptomyces sp. DSM 40473]